MEKVIIHMAQQMDDLRADLAVKEKSKPSTSSSDYSIFGPPVKKQTVKEIKEDIKEDIKEKQDDMDDIYFVLLYFIVYLLIY